MPSFVYQTRDVSSLPPSLAEQHMTWLTTSKFNSGRRQGSQKAGGGSSSLSPPWELSRNKSRHVWHTNMHMHCKLLFASFTAFSLLPASSDLLLRHDRCADICLWICLINPDNWESISMSPPCLNYLLKEVTQDKSVGKILVMLGCREQIWSHDY